MYQKLNAQHGNPTPRKRDSHCPATAATPSKKTDLIVDHKNDALSCKFNRSVHIVMEMSSRTEGPPARSQARRARRLLLFHILFVSKSYLLSSSFLK